MRQEELEGHGRETEAQGAVGAERAFPGSPRAAMPNPGFPTSPSPHPNPKPALQLAQWRGWSLKGSCRAPDPEPQGTALPWRRRVRFRQRVSRQAPIQWSPGPRAWPGAGGSESG